MSWNIIFLMRVSVVGVGNELKADDGIGVFIAGMLEKILPEKMKKHEFQFIRSANPENHVQEIVRFLPDLVIVVDSADFNGSPGEYRLIEEKEVEGYTYSTHNAPLTLFMNAVRKTSPGEPEILLVGIQPKNMGFGEGLSNEIKLCAKDVIKFITDLIKGGEVAKEEGESPVKPLELED
jgi:hydrogenase 3 maturation protease